MLRIKELRLLKNLTQKELAEKINSSSKNIWAYENDFATPPLDVLIRLADYFECSIDYLVSREDDFGVVKINGAGAELTSDEKSLLETFRKLNVKNRLHVAAYADVRLEEQEKGSLHA